MSNGAQQTKEILWFHVMGEYTRMCTEQGVKTAKPKRSPLSFRPRTPRGLQIRFGEIQKEVNRFIGDYARATVVERRSGAVEADFMDDANRFYTAKHGFEFKFVPEFLFLRGFKKYLHDIAQAATADLKQGGVRKGPGGPGSRKVVRMRQVDTDDEDEGNNVPGQKKARTLAKEKEALDIAVAKNLAAIAEEEAKYLEKALLHRQSIRSDEDRAASDRLAAEVNLLKEDNEVMRMDLSGMNDFQCQYFEELRVQIALRMDARKATRIADAERVVREAAEAAEEVRRASEYAMSPEGMAAARAAEEAVDRAEGDRAAAAVEANAARAREEAAAAVRATAPRAVAPPATPPTQSTVLVEGEEEEEAEEEEGETEEEAYAMLLEAFAKQRTDEDESEAMIYVWDTPDDTADDTQMEPEENNDPETPPPDVISATPVPNATVRPIRQQQLFQSP